MAAKVMTVGFGVEPHQATFTTGTSASETAGAIKIVIPDGATNAQIAGALAVAAEAARRDPNVFRAH